MRRIVGVLGASVLLAVLFAPPAGATITPPTKFGIFYGDSLMWESNWKLQASMGSTWQATDKAVIGSAPCDWVKWLPADLVTFHPQVVTLASAGNTGGPGSCETNAYSSPEYLADYTSELTTFVQDVTATGAQMVFVEDPPFLDPPRNAAVIQVNAIELQLAQTYPGVSFYKAARSGLSNRGAYTAYKPCKKTELALPDCVDGQIAIRTIAGPGIGLHLCPDGVFVGEQCEIYSSGESRFGTYLSAAAKHPKPIIPFPLTPRSG